MKKVAEKHSKNPLGNEPRLKVAWGPHLYPHSFPESGQCWLLTRSIPNLHSPELGHLGAPSEMGHTLGNAASDHSPQHQACLALRMWWEKETILAACIFFLAF